jgi:hypothetical protein
MPQQQPHRNPSESGDPPIGECAVCEEPVTRDDPGTLTFVASTGSMATVHDRCQPGADAAPPAS